MKKILISSLFIISIFLAFACTERITIPLDNSKVRLIVDGSVTTDSIRQKVVLTETTSYYFDQPAPGVSGAAVSISDGDSVFSMHEDSDGIYITDAAMAGIPGKTYTLSIDLAAPVGGYSSYTASSVLYPVSRLDSVSLAFHPDWSDNGVWEVKCFVQDPPTKDFYRFLVYNDRRMITDTLNNWFVTDDRFFNGNYAYGAPIAYLRQGRNNEALNSGDTVTVEVNSIGEAYANFILEAQAEERGSNPLFSGPPANVKGNINNGAVGFFAAYSVSRAFTIVRDTI
jgi:hypothetical protein